MRLFQLLLLTLSWTCVEPLSKYCAKRLCQHEVPFACNKVKKISKGCGRNARILRFSHKMKNFICDEHNEYRNKIASGLTRGFSPAARMATIQWSNELAKLARLNVQNCNLRRDNCSNTRSFPFVGQNLGSALNISCNQANVQAYLKRQILQWYNEYESGTMEIMNKYRALASPDESIEHFAQMIKDRANYIGCSLLKATGLKHVNFYLTCNYALGNKPDEAVYESGARPTSACNMGHDSTFLSLCAKNESYSILNSADDNTNRDN